MKTLKSILLGVAMVAVCTVANAKSVVSGGDDVVNTYVAAVTQGDVKNIDQIMESYVTFNMVGADDETRSLDTKQVIAGLKANEGVKTDFVTTVTKGKETAKTAIYVVAMKSGASTRFDTVTLAQSKSGWKIADVTTSYKKASVEE